MIVRYLTLLRCDLDLIPTYVNFNRHVASTYRVWHADVLFQLWNPQSTKLAWAWSFMFKLSSYENRSSVSSELWRAWLLSHHSYHTINITYTRKPSLEYSMSFLFKDTLPKGQRIKSACIALSASYVPGQAGAPLVREPGSSWPCGSTHQHTASAAWHCRGR